MGLDLLTHAQPAKLGLAGDLRVWMDEETLVRLTLEAVSDVDWPRLAGRTMFDADQPLPVAVMLTLLTYCYATGRYASEDIEACVLSDATVRYLAVGHRPSWQAIRQFRRRNCGLLAAALQRLLQAAQRHRNGRELACDPAPPPLATFALAADERIRRAIQADSMAMDF